jgi:serine/threonine protein kinase
MLHPNLRPNDPEHLDHHLSFVKLMGRALSSLTEVRLRSISYRGDTGEVAGLGSSFRVATFPPYSSSSATAKLDELVTKFPEKAKKADNWASRLDAILSELRVLTARPVKNHPNIVQLRYWAWKDARSPLGLVYPGLFLERAPLGTLMDFQQPKHFSLRFMTKLKICHEVAVGLAFLHACGVIHGDVKPENVLLFPPEANTSPPRAKLSDFSHSLFEIDAEDGKLCWRGWTNEWAAPEVLTQAAQTIDLIYRSDIFSFGLCFWHIMLESEEQLPSRPRVEISNDLSMLSFAIKTICQNPKDLDMELVGKVLRMTLPSDPGMRASNMDEIVDTLREGLLRCVIDLSASITFVVANLPADSVT